MWRGWIAAAITILTLRRGSKDGFAVFPVLESGPRPNGEPGDVGFVFASTEMPRRERWAATGSIWAPGFKREGCVKLMVIAKF